MIIDGIQFNKLAVCKMSLEEFKNTYKGKFTTVDILQAAKMLGIKNTFKPKQRGKKDKTK
tara:strand:+ start:522 stop:701 length:180 start_codon:yes stop_codon:yes gene_type:complete